MNFLTAFVKIVLDDKALPRQLARAKAAVTRTVSAIKATFSKMAASFKAAFSKMVRYAKWGGLAITGALILATRAAMKQQDVIARLETTLKATGYAAELTKEELLDMASKLQSLTKFGDETITAMQTMLLTFKQIKGDQFERATMAALDMATAEAAVSGRSVDLSAAVIRLGKALNDPILGVTALRRVGVQLTEQQEKQIKTFVELGKVTEAQKIILGELESQFGGMATTVDTGSGALRQMWNALGDVAEVIGGALLPRLTETFKRIKAWAEDNEKRIGEWAETWVEKIGIVMDKLWDLITILTTDFSKGMKIIKEELIIFFSALVETFLIAGIAAGKAFWRGIGMGKPSQAEITARRREELEADAPLIWKEGDRARIQRELVIEQIQKELGVVEQLKATWQDVGKAMSEAIPPRLPKEPKEARMGREASYMLPSVDTVRPSVDAAEEAAERLKEIDRRLNEEMEENARRTTDILVGMSEERAEHEIANRMAVEEVTKGLAEKEAARVAKAAERQKRIAEDIAVAMARSWTNAIDQMTFEGKRFWDAMEDMARSLIRTIMQIIMYKKIAEPLAYGIMGLPIPGAQAGGHVEKTGIVKVHKGEDITPAGRGSGITVNVNDYAGVNVEIDEERTYMNSDQRIIDVTMKAAGSHGPYRRSLRQVRRF